MTTEWRIDKAKIEHDIYIANRCIRGVQHAKLKREKVLAYLKKQIKDSSVIGIFKRNIQELINGQFNEVEGRGEQKSLIH